MLHLLATLPSRSQDLFDPQANLDVSVWTIDANVCEMRSLGNCDTAVGVYYGSAEDEVTKFCPRHFYESHFGPDAPYRLVDP